MAMNRYSTFPEGSKTGVSQSDWFVSYVVHSLVEEESYLPAEMQSAYSIASVAWALHGIKYSDLIQIVSTQLDGFN